MVRSLETQTSPYIAIIIVVHYTRTSGRSWFWNIGRGSRSMRGILVNIELDFPFMITKLPVKILWNRSRTFWVILITHRKTNRKKTDSHETIPLPNTVWGEVTNKQNKTWDIVTSYEWRRFDASFQQASLKAERDEILLQNKTKIRTANPKKQKIETRPPRCNRPLRWGDTKIKKNITEKTLFVDFFCNGWEI